MRHLILPRFCAVCALYLPLLGIAAALVAAAPLAIAAPPNKAPTVSITAPTNGATFTAGANIAITAAAADSDGTVAKVAFYRGGTTLLGTATASPYSIVWTGVPAGSYSLTAIATDNLGATKTSTAVAITVNPPPNSPPSVTIVSPASGARYTAPATVTITANASDSDGTVGKVEFYQGDTLLGTATAAPYTVTWTNVGIGSYALTARATDNLAATATSTAVNIAVGAPNQPPLVVLTAPPPCAVYDAPASMVLAADALDPDGSIGRVEFLQGSTVVGTVTAEPYLFTWTNVSVGVYALAARATDNQGATTTSTPVTVSVRSTNQPPVISLTAPANGATFSAPATIGLAATASDPDGSVAKVEFYSGATLLAAVTTPPYAYTWTNVTTGTYTLTAKATDNLGAVTTCTAVNITVTNTPPVVTLTAPAAGSRYLPLASIILAATASDNDGTVTKVEFFADGSLVGTANAAPFTATWRNAAAGNHGLTAKATDNLGASTTTAPVSISIDAPPVVTLTAPADGTVYPAPGNVTITAHATDSDGTLAKVELFHDGMSMAAATPAAGSTDFTLNYTWNPAPAASYVLTAQATDNDGALTTSAPVHVFVHAAPTVTLTAPATGSNFMAPASINLTAAVTISGATVNKVDFYAGTTLLGMASSAPFSVTWSSVPAGSYSLTATVTDSLGGTATSAAASVTVSNNRPPTVSLTAPTDGANYFAPATVNLAALASDSDGTVTKVEFYQGGALLGAVTAPPYALTWNNVLAGSYAVTAAATDNLGARTISLAANIAVAATGFAITSPADGSTVGDVVVNVAGSVQAPVNSGVTVNGIVAALDGAGHFYASGVPLVPGANTIAAILTGADGQTSTRSITLNSTGPSPILISASPTQGLSPLDVTFTASALAGTTIQKMELDWNGDGVFDFTQAVPDWTIKLSGLGISSGTYVFNVAVRVTDTQANVYTQTIPIVVTTAAVLDQQLRAVWSGMTNALAAGDKTVAMNYLSPQAQKIYGPVFDALRPNLSQIIGSWSPPVSGILTTGLGEYGVVTTDGSSRYLFLIYFLQGSDGVWRLDSM